jgi:hypothetical protein
MKFKIPKTFNMLGTKIKVKLSDSKDFAGLWDPELNTIFISVHQTDKQLEETFWHEVTHCEQWLTALNQAIPRELLETMAEMRSRLAPSLIRKFYSK